MATEFLVWKKYNGIDVLVDDNGEFCAEVSGVFLRDRAWEGLRVRIEQEKKSDAKAMKIELDCLALIGDADNGDYSVARLTMVGLSRKDHSFKWSEPQDASRIVHVLPNSQKNAALLQELAIARSAVRDIEQAIKDRTIYQDRWGGRIEATKYNEELRDLKERYQRAMEGSA